MEVECMSTVKLTLSTDEQLVREMKRLARKRGTSISALFSTFARSLEEEDFPQMPTKIGPLTRACLGVAKLPKGKTAEQVLKEAIFEKYGIKK
jgi:hypothetical protein